MINTQITRNLKAIAVLLTVFFVIPVQANLLQNHADITNAVKEYVIHQKVPLNNVQVTLTSLNNQIQFPKCDKSLRVEIAPGAKLIGNTTFAVSCQSTIEWKIHVAAHIDGQVNALIARHPITRGTVINSTDLEFVTRRYSQLNHGYYESDKLLINMEAKRNIKAGQILTPALVKAQKLVLRGQHITIIAQNKGINLSVKGKALMDGKKGQTIKVRNLSSKKLIYARVISPGIVKVNF